VGLSVGVGGAVWLATGRGTGLAQASEKSALKSPTVVVNNTPVSREDKLTTSFSPIVKRTAPTVVNIFTTKTIKRSLGPEWPFPFRFFGDPFEDGQGSPGRSRTFKERSLGSGVLVTEDGYILTNNHVVDGADEIMVYLAKDKKEYTAKVVGKDPRTDIAVLKISASSLPFITLGDSDKIEVGDVVLALGNPFAIGQTVTMGIVSAVGRGGMGIEDYEDFIQTDAAINPGNSGGALVDAQGRLIGINTAILSQTGGSHGVGFAVPVNLARNVMDHLIKDGRVVRGYMGVSIQDLNPELAKEFGLSESNGALVSDVTEDSAAAAAGLKSGDVIIEFEGKPVQDSRNLRLAVARYAPGTKVTVKVLRQGKEQTFKVTLKEMSESRLVGGRPDSTGGSDDVLDGVEVGDITPAIRNQLQLPAAIKGAVITGIEADSAAYRDGLRQGDVILEINRKPIRSADEAVAASEHAPSKKVLVRIWRGGGSRYVVVDESK